MRTLCSRVVLGSLAITCLAVSTGVAREWSDNTGRFRVEASFVEVDGDEVVLRLDDGNRLLNVPLRRLSAADQAYVEEQLANVRPAEPNDGPEASDLLASIKLEPHVQWSGMFVADENGNREPPLLEIGVIARGDAAAQALRYGKMNITRVVDNNGRDLVRSDDGFSFEDIAEEMVEVERDFS